MTASIEARGVGAKGYSQVTSVGFGDAGSLVFVSGQVSRDEKGNVVGEGDFTTQCNFVYRQIQEQLKSMNTDMDRVLKVTVFLKDFNNYDELIEIRKKWFHPDHPPASTAVAIKELVDSNLLLEIEAIAVGP